MTDAGFITFKSLRGLVVVGRNWRREVSGAAAVEFGLIAGMFVMMICVWLELGLTLMQQAALDRAVLKEARLIRTGVITASGENTFKANLCADLSAVMTCGDIQYNVASGSSFASLSAAVPSSSTSRMTTTGFSPGSSGSDVIVQVGYTRKVAVPLAASVVGQNGTLLIYSSVAFQNEPY